MIPLDGSTLALIGGAAATPLGLLAYQHLASAPREKTKTYSRNLGLSDHFVYGDLIEPGTVLTTYGGLGAMFEIEWHDTSAIGDDQRIIHYGDFNDAIRLKRNGWMQQTWTLKSKAEPLSAREFALSEPHRILNDSHVAHSSGRFRIRHLIALTYLPPIEQAGLLQKAIFTGELPVSESFEKVRAEFEAGILAYTDTIRRIGTIRRLGQESWRSLLLEAIAELIDGEAQPIRGPEPFESASIAGLMACHDVDPAGRLPRIGDKHLRVLSISAYPTQSHPGMLYPFLHVNVSGVRYATRSIFQDVEKAREQLDFMRRVWGGQKQSGLQKALPADTDGRVDRFAARKEDEFEDAIDAARTQQVAFVHFSAKAVFLHEDLAEQKEAIREVTNALRAAGLRVQLEGINTVEAYLGHLPFDGYHDVCEAQVHTLNVARLIPATSRWEGRTTWDCKQCGDVTVPALIGVTDTGEDFAFDPHSGQVQSFIAIAKPGGGKSTDRNALAAGYLRSPNDQAFLIDKGRTALVTTLFLGGEYHEDERYWLFGGLDDPNRLTWMSQFLAMLGAVNGVEVDAGQRDRVKTTLERLLECNERDRTLSTCLALLDAAFSRSDRGGRALVEAIAQYALGGVHRGVFDGVPCVGSETSPLETHELGALLGGNQDDLVAGPVLLWLLRSFEECFPGHRSIELLDEVWTLLQSEAAADLLNEQLRTLRYRHAGAGFYTHSLADIRASKVGSTVITACETRILYPNAEAATEFLDLYEGIGLTAAQIDRIKNADARTRFLSAAGRFGAYKMNYSPAQLAVFGCTGHDEVGRARRLIQERPDDWREVFLRNAGCNREADQVRSLSRNGHLNGRAIKETVLV